MITTRTIIPYWGRVSRGRDAERTQVSLTLAADGSLLLDVANNPN